MLASELLKRLVPVGATEVAAGGRMTSTGPTGIVQIAAVSDVIDLVAAAPVDYTLLPPMPYRIDRQTTAWLLYAKGGTISTSPTYSVGTNAGTFDNLLPAQTSAAFTTQAAMTLIVPGSFASPVPLSDLTTSGLRVRISIAATGVAPVLTARFRIQAVLVPV